MTQETAANAVAAEGPPVQAPTTVEALEAAPAVPTLDEIMPELDRKGKRGALSTAERDYSRRRALLAGVLEQNNALRTALDEKAIEASAVGEDLVLAQAKIQALTHANQTTARDLEMAREAHARTRRLTLVRETAETQFCRLTGLELTSFYNPYGDNVNCTVLGQPAAVTLTVAPDAQTLSITIAGHANVFDLTEKGEIQPKDALAILSLFGLKRNLHEALSAMAARSVFGLAATRKDYQETGAQGFSVYAIEPISGTRSLGKLALGENAHPYNR